MKIKHSISGLTILIILSLLIVYLIDLKSKKMEKYKFVKQENAIMRGEGSDYVISNYITKEDSRNVSLAISTLEGTVPATLNNISDRLYFFLEADATFEFEDGEVVTVEKNSTLFIPKNTKYKMKGKFKAVLINTPPFDIINEKHFDE
jgi:hypothetical protein